VGTLNSLFYFLKEMNHLNERLIAFWDWFFNCSAI